MYTYPNQKIINISKESYKNWFLQVGIDEWQKAYKELKPSTFGLYLYLAGNADGFDLALSRQAVENAIGIKKTAYHNAINELTEKGYINLIQGNILRFTTTPRAVRKSEPPPQNKGVHASEPQSLQMRSENSVRAETEVHKNDTEINKINKTNKINIIKKGKPNQGIHSEKAREINEAFFGGGISEEARKLGF